MEAYKVTYILYCIGKFAHHYHLSDKQAYAYLRRHKGIDFLVDNYVAGHQLSLDDAVKDLASVCRRYGGGLPC